MDDVKQFGSVMKLSILASVVILMATVVTCALARPVAMWDYDKKFEMADLAVIATPIHVEDTKERIDLPGISVGRLNRPNTGLPVIGVNTRFAISSTRKGNPELKEIVMHHYRRVSEPEVSVNGASLVAFDPTKETYFLLFLKRESDGRYAPLDQIDPGMNSVEQVLKGEK